MISAIISQVLGVAIFDNGAEFGVLDLKLLGKPFFCDERDAWKLICDSIDLEHLEVVNIDALWVHLKIRKSREEMLRAALILLDGERSKSLRSMAASVLSAHRAYNEWTWVAGVLLSTPLPDGADAIGAAEFETPFQQFFGELLPLQARIATLQTAWNALPAALFSNETRKNVHLRMVRNSIFLRLINGASGNSKTPFHTALQNFATELKESREHPHVLFVVDKQSSNQIKNSHVEHKQLLWAAAPWRAAWLDSVWPRIEPTLACQTADVFTHHYFAKKAKDNDFDLDQLKFEVLFNSWDSVRHDSEILTSISLISKLANLQPKSKKWNAVVGQGIKKTNTAAVSVKLPPRFLEVRDLIKQGGKFLNALILDFFGMQVTQSKDNIDEMQFKSAGDRIFYKTHHHDDKAKISNWAATCAHRAHFFFDSQTPLNLIGNNSYTDEFIFESKINFDDIQKNIQILNDLIGLYALDRIFQNNGCVIIVMKQSQSNNKKKKEIIPQRTSILNFNTRRVQLFDGLTASLIEILQRRLTADLRSGLPVEYCGWIKTEELRGNSEEDASEFMGTIDKLCENIWRAGFAPEMIQQLPRSIRLNPELAASAIIGAWFGADD